MVSEQFSYRFRVFFFFLADLLDITRTESSTVLVKQFGAYPVSAKKHCLLHIYKDLVIRICFLLCMRLICIARPDLIQLP